MTEPTEKTFSAKEVTNAIRYNGACNLNVNHTLVEMLGRGEISLLNAELLRHAHHEDWSIANWRTERALGITSKYAEKRLKEIEEHFEKLRQERQQRMAQSVDTP